jgi:uncharacterized protein YggE
MSKPVVTVRGEAQLEAPPDRAGLSVTLHASGESADQTRAELAAASGTVSAVLREFAAALERSSTSGLHVSPVFNRRTPTRITGYTGTFRSSLVVQDFEALSPLIQALARLPDSQLDGPWWSLRPDHPVHREVRLAAIADARHRADDYAAAFGATVSELIEVSDLDRGFSGGRQRLAAFAESGMADDASFAFEPEVQTVSGQVTVSFTLDAALLK